MKRVFLYIVLFLLIAGGAYAQKLKAPPKLAPDNWAIPQKPIGWVSDFENIFTAYQVNYLSSIIKQQMDSTSNQIAIVSLPPDITGIKSQKDLEGFSVELMNKWGVGVKGKDNGVGIIFSVKLKMIRIATGIGLITKLTDLESKSIIERIILPEFRKADYYTGILKGLQAIIKEID